ncbi:MAG: hypothetical protein AB7P69_09055 [Candidatus Binatia bacterium]
MALWNNRGIRQRVVIPLMVIVVLSFSAPTFAFEREGTVIYFSLEDLQLAFPRFLQRDTLLSLIPQMSWQTLQADQANDDNGPIERSMRWGNGLGIDGYRPPGMHPLWGY